MNDMVLLVGTLRFEEDNDCACSHDLAVVLSQVQVGGQHLLLEGKAFKTVPVNHLSHVITCLEVQPMGGNI